MDFKSVASEPVWASRLAGTPFASALSRGAPLFAACGNPPQVVFATAAALAAFGAADAAALEAAVLRGESAAARRLARLAAETPADAPLRLEYLRFFVARKPLGAQWLCGRIKRDGETFFVAADATEGFAETSAGTFAADRPPSQGVENSQDAMSFDPPALEGPVRFVWRLDGRDRFMETDAALTAQLGPSAPRPGETLLELVTRANVRHGGAWADAVAARAPFSALRVEWMEPGGRQARVARLSGAPSLGAAGRFNGYRGFGVFTGESVSLGAAAAPPPAAPTPEPAKPSALNAVSSRDASALIEMLRQRAPRVDAAAPPATAPALAIITALASLLQPKTHSAPAESREPPPSTSPARPNNGAEIVVLRPPAANRDAPTGESVALTSQERDAFKEIARALGANVRGAPAAVEAAAEEPATEADSASPGADLAALFDILPIAALVTVAGAPVYVNATWLDLTGYSSLEDFRARNGLNAVFRGRDPQVLAPAEATAGIPLVAANGEIFTVDAQVKAARWGGEPALFVALRRSREADHQAELRALESEAARHAARARDLSALRSTRLVTEWFGWTPLDASSA